MSLTWLITGSAGFIGSNLVVQLLKGGHKVIGIDNLSTGKQVNVDRALEKAEGRYQFICGDICVGDDIKKCFEQKINVVVHLAAQGSVQRSFDDAEYNNKLNVDGFLKVMQASGAKSVSRFIYASSCAVYGDTEVLPISESQCPAPLSPYASSKLMNELLSRNLAHLYPDTSFIGLRFFNVFGPWQDPLGDYAAVIPRWIDLCMDGRQPVVFGDGNATRDFCYVGNICDLVERIAVQKILKTGIVYNVSSGVSTSLNELYNTVLSGLNEKGYPLSFKNPIYKPWREGDIEHSLGSIELVKKDLDFEPKVGLSEGVGEILKSQYGL